MRQKQNETDPAWSSWDTNNFFFYLLTHQICKNQTLIISLWLQTAKNDFHIEILCLIFSQNIKNFLNQEENPSWFKKF